NLVRVPLNRKIRIFQESKVFDSMWIIQVDQDSHSFSCGRVEYGLQQAGKAEWRGCFWYRQLWLGHPWMGISFSGRGLSKKVSMIRHRAGYRRMGKPVGGSAAKA